MDTAWRTYRMASVDARGEVQGRTTVHAPTLDLAFRLARGQFLFSDTIRCDGSVVEVTAGNSEADRG
jgi:hypothetical protein